MEKLLTIVVPVYNTEKYLDFCLKSLIVNDFMDQLEVIVVIDGSPDNSIEIAKSFEQKYPQTFKVINKENGGHGSCCNIGLNLAKGKYIRFLDSDDWFDNSNFPIFLKKIQNLDVDLIQTNRIDEFLYKGVSKKIDICSKLSSKIYDAKLFDFSSFEYFITIHCSTFKTNSLRESGIKFSEKISFDDTALYVTPFRTIKTILFLDLYIYHYFIGRPGQSVGFVNERSLKFRKHEYIKLIQDFVKIKNSLSQNQKEFAIKLICHLLDEYFDLLKYLPYRLFIQSFDEWYEIVRKYSFVDQKSLYWLQNYNKHNKFCLWLIYNLRKKISVLKRQLFSYK